MIENAPRLLFVPVSGPFGMGEYARSLAIAQGCARRWPAATIHFVLSRQAPYAAGAPFSTTLLDSSPTFHSADVIRLVRDWRPHVVIFDNAGRTAQLRAAARSGARLVYISARRRQRKRAFRLGWMRMLDEHWIAYPRFIAGDLGAIERLKLWLLRRPRLRFLDVILAPGPSPGAASGRVLQGCDPGSYVLVVPGGGTGHPRALDAAARFLAAARDIAASGTDTVFVGAAPGDTLPHLRLPGSLPQPDLAHLMRGAKLIITNGGSTLLQAIACGRPCIAAPIADDQGERIRRCVAAGVAIPAPLEAGAIGALALDLIKDERARAALEARAASLGLADGVDIAVRALVNLLQS